jgi:hypothetical protein
MKPGFSAVELSVSADAMSLRLPFDASMDLERAAGEFSVPGQITSGAPQVLA